MKYLLMIHSNPESRAIWETFSEEEQRAGYGAHAALNEALAAAGALVVSEGLDDVSTAKRVRVRDGRVIATDGPFAEVKEHLVGFYLLECDSIEQAVEWAARIPDAVASDIEVRPVLDLAQFDLPGAGG